jgi:hypothetical protein
MSERTAIERALQEMVRSASDDLPIEKFVLQFGRYFPGSPRPPGIVRGHLHECYINAATLALKEGSVARYAEGYAYKCDLQSPFLHAWCIAGGLVVDNTLPSPEEFDYFGVVIPTEILRENLRETGTYGVITGELGPNIMAAWKTIAGPAPAGPPAAAGGDGNADLTSE